MWTILSGLPLTCPVLVYSVMLLSNLEITIACQTGRWSQSSRKHVLILWYFWTVKFAICQSLHHFQMWKYHNCVLTLHLSLTCTMSKRTERYLQKCKTVIIDLSLKRLNSFFGSLAEHAFLTSPTEKESDGVLPF